MKILKPAIPFAERWYAEPITCPHCYSEFALDEADFIPTHDYNNYASSRHYTLSIKGITGSCPSCHSALYVEKPA